jgi:hypothetical protein
MVFHIAIIPERDLAYQANPFLLPVLQRRMERTLKTGIHALQPFVQTLKQDRSAVEAVTEP